MKNITNSNNHSTPKRTFVALACSAFALVSSGLLSSCAYTETMNEREAEGHRLQGELGYEIEKGNRLTR